ncbi:MAG: TIGR03915 family putative DNA repair protein, partial [Clostridiales bacterium]|nr:TIGR03915 family putative DNA repair protein [Clostridiales bacterium]
MEEIAHIIDGSFEGLLTSIFEAYSQKRFPSRVCAGCDCQLDFSREQIHIRTDRAKADRVKSGILRRIGAEAYDQAWTAFLSNDEARCVKIMRYIALGFKAGRALPGMLADPAVLAVMELARPVARECNKLLGFVRFSLMENGVQFAEIAPEHNQLPLLTPHFADRFPEIPFALYDSRRKLAGLHSAREWRIVAAEGLALPGYAA